MSALGHDEAPIVSQAAVDDAQQVFTAREKSLGHGSISAAKTADMDVRSESDEDSNHDITDEELQKLRRVSGKIPWQAFTIAFCELCERFSYYGTTIVCMSTRTSTMFR